MFPRQAPAFGLTLPVEFVRARDGDTVVVSVPGSEREWAVRLKNSWCPELDTPTGQSAKAFVEEKLAETKYLALHLPLPTDANLLKSLSFDRVVGYLFVAPDLTLNELLIFKQLASSLKNGVLGE